MDMSRQVLVPRGAVVAIFSGWVRTVDGRENHRCSAACVHGLSTFILVANVVV